MFCVYNLPLLFLLSRLLISLRFFLVLLLEIDSHFEFHLGFPNQHTTMIRASVGHCVLVVFV